MLYTFSGALNAYTVPNVQARLYEMIEKQNVVIDFSSVIEIDSSGLGMIMALHNDADEFHTKLYLMSLSNEVDHAISTTGFKDLFRIINAATEAI